VPHEPATHPIPLTVQVTLALEVPETFAVNCCWPFTAILTELGETETLTLVELLIVTVAVPWEKSARENAATVTVDGEGAVKGATYKPLESIDPQVMPLQPAPVTLQTTTPLGEAVN
jgi:hypothetical protein